MALLDNVVKQRMVGALVLVALAVIFLPMLFSREDEQRQVRVEAPAAPAAPTMPQVQVEPVQVPEPEVIPEPTTQASATSSAPSMPIAPASTAPAATTQPAPAVAASKPAPAPAPAPAAKPAPAAAPPVTSAAKPDTAAKKVDANGLPVSWSIQLASLSSRANAEAMQKKLRSQGYNAYIRTSGGMNRVFVGPLVERAEADRLRDLLDRQQNLKGFVVRFQPERG
ncbi:SPOR domain-containing protein [Pseudomonas sp. R5(2019)]|uniref:SPOR domain-containing protein n=1 Tax=Pseudomonas sp. R5(2019) TaxID=2697566 RepID=UPI001411FE46|nr:SPOR domain-containing protein [Pseudomonas sp. R5(2019)]NBA94240.1 SPOR domain-containing protein [Pseudomonas sp. R5(2019)]